MYKIGSGINSNTLRSFANVYLSTTFQQPPKKIPPFPLLMKTINKMIARIIVILALAASAPITYILEEVDTIRISRGETVRIDSPSKTGSLNMWVVGRFPSNKIVPNEGRLGDRFSERKTPDGRLIQTWTIQCTGGNVGEELDMDFWYLKPQYAEQYFNDPEAYEAMHGEIVKTRNMKFIVTAKDL